MTIKELFDKAENGTLTYEQFEALATAGKAKFADLGEGNYVSKHKYDADLGAKAKEIETLNGSLTTRDTDLANLQKQLEAAGTDASKLEELNNQLTSWQNKYNEDTKKYEAQLARQAYEFAVKDYATTQKFSSQAAKRDFIQSMLAENLKLKDGKILGADDFVKSYTEQNEDAFVYDVPEPDFEPEPLPAFVQSTPGGQPAPVDSNAFSEAFHFTGVRPIPD